MLSDDEIKSAHPKSTQTIEIFSFVDAADIPLANIDTPYYLAPDKRGEKVYALLRQTLSDSATVGLASVVLHTKQHLAAVMAVDSALVLILLRWPSEVRSLDTLELTTATTKATLSKAEKDMAKRLVADMKGKWNPEEYRDTFQEKIMALVDKKAAEGKIEDVETDAGEEPRKTADIIDLTELLKRSLGGNKAAKPSAKTAAVKAKKPASSKSVDSKASAKKATPSATSSGTSSTVKKASATKKAASPKIKQEPKKASSK